MAEIQKDIEYSDTQEYRPTKIHKKVDHTQIHWKRRSEIIKKHPDVKELYGKDNMTGAWSVVLVILQYVLAYLVFEFSKTDHAIENPKLFLFEVFLLAYCIGAVIDHGLWVLIHDLGHDLGFESGFFNSLFLCISNIPHLLPSGSSFKFYHKLHHIHLNETYSDPDMASPWEAKIFGNSPLGKALWMSLFPIFQLTRASRGPMMPFSIEMLFNYILNISVNVVFIHHCGYIVLFYLLTSGFFAVGFHPLGTRWIAEHYAVHPDQETYSYYGEINSIAFNIGYHNEHHDFPQTIPWSRLPMLTEKASDFYKSLYIHTSYSKVMWNFIFDSNFTLHSRVVRDNRKLSEGEGEELISSKAD
jgi:sphingolipid delta-4 desaturase